MPLNPCENLLIKYVRPFLEQKNKDDDRAIKHQKGLTWQQAEVDESAISVAFGITKDLESSADQNALPEDGEETKETAYDRANSKCSKVYKFLEKHWEVDEEGWFRRKNAEPKVTVYEKYPEELIRKLLRKCQGDIKVIDTYSTFLFDLHKGGGDRDFILELLSTGDKKFNLLVLDPTGNIFESRLRTIHGGLSASFRDNILRGLRELLEISKLYKFEVRLMDELPGMHGILLPDTLFFGLHFSFAFSQNASFFEVAGNKHHVYNDFTRHFDDLWQPAHSRKLDDTMVEVMAKKIRQANQTFEDLIAGSWEIYFHDRWQRPDQQEDSILGNISRALLKVDKPQHEFLMTASLSFWDAQLKRQQTLESKVQFESLEDCNFAHMRFTNHEQISIRLSVRCRIEQDMPLMGLLALMNHYDIYTSAMLLYRVPSTRQPLLPAFDVEADAELVRSLGFRHKVSFSLERFRKKFHQNRVSNEFSMFKGVYKMYAYGRSRSKGGTGIQENIIEILESGYVAYQHVNFEAYGVASVKENNLHIKLTHSTRDHRTGYLILHTKNVENDKNRVYVGVFLGISMQQEDPMARRVVLLATPGARINDESARFYLLNSVEYNALPEGIHKLLTGPVENNLGFPRSKGDIFDLRSLKKEWQRSLHYKEVFLDAAYYYALKNNEDRERNKRSALKMLARAVRHGFRSLEKFEKNLAGSAIGEDILKSKKYLRIKELVEGEHL